MKFETVLFPGSGQGAPVNYLEFPQIAVRK